MFSRVWRNLRGDRLLRGKHIFIGNTNVLAHWIAEFPDLINDVAVFLEGCDFGRHIASNNLEIWKDLNNVIVVASDYYVNNYKRFEDTYVFVYIRDYVSQQVINSELMPGKLRVEASTVCQLDCKECYMRITKNGTMGKGFLSFQNFKKLIDENPFITEIELSNSGEIFLNPDLIEIMKYAYERKVKLTALNGVNFNNVTELQLEALVKYKFCSLMISIDGASPSVYEIYRRKGNYITVINNIKKLIEIKKRYKSDMPHITWQYIIMEHNEADVVLAKKTAKSLGIPIWFKLTWNDEYIPYNREFLEKETGLTVFNRKEYCHKMSKVYLGSTVCNQLFLSPQINWDGRLLGCCEIYLEDYGVNVFDVGLRKALKNPNFIAAKKYLLSNKSSQDSGLKIPCSSCLKMLNMQKINERIEPFKDV